MKKEDIKGFTNRVVQANKSELIVILYDIVIHDLEESKELLTKKNELKKAFLPEQQTEYQKCLDHSCKAVNELMVSLDFQYEISAELFRLYRYVNECVTKAKTTNEIELLTEALNTMNALRSSFVQVASQDTSGPVMQNTEQVYAGLTYSKGNLNESLLDPNAKRGFRA